VLRQTERMNFSPYGNLPRFIYGLVATIMLVGAFWSVADGNTLKAGFHLSLFIYFGWKSSELDLPV
jgi:hypothetical protein